MRFTSLIAVLASASTTGAATCSNDYDDPPCDVAGFTVAGMLNRSKIGLDIDNQVVDLEKFAADPAGNATSYAAAYSIWESGKYSYNDYPNLRSIEGFCNSLKLAKTDIYNLALGSGQPKDYCTDYSDAAFKAFQTSNADPAGTGLSPLVPINAQILGDILGYVNYELWDAFYDFQAGTINNNEGQVKVIDKAWTVYTLIGQQVGSTKGSGQYALTERMAVVYGQGGGTGEACAINAKLLVEYDALRTLMTSSTDDGTYNDPANLLLARRHIYSIEMLETASALQFYYKNAYDFIAGGDLTYWWNAQSALQIIRPQMQACFTCPMAAFDEIMGTAGGVTSSNTDSYGSYYAAASSSAATRQSLYDQQVSLVEQAYPCMHVACSVVGGFPGHAECTSFPFPDTEVPIAGYQPAGGTVTPHSYIDSDIRRMYLYTKAEVTRKYAWDHLKDIYDNGWNSPKSSGIWNYRSMKRFSYGPGALSKLVDNPTYRTYTDYWGPDDYADQWQSSLLPGGQYWPADGASESLMTFQARGEMVIKGNVDENALMYAYGELGDGNTDCVSAGPSDDPVHHLSEGVVFLLGHNVKPSGTPTLAAQGACGNMDYSNAIKRQSQFGTGTVSNANSNTKFLDLANAGKAELTKSSPDCATYNDLVMPMIRQMNVPNYQGMLRYAYKGSVGGATAKERAEGWAFTRAVLPLINECNSTAGTIVRNQMDFFTGLYQGEPVYRAMDEVYSCLGYTCAEIGNLSGSDCPLGVCPTWTQCDAIPAPAPTPAAPTPTPASGANTAAASIVATVAAVICVFFAMAF